MNKKFFLILTGIFSLYFLDSAALKVRIPCALHDSKKCTTVEGFLKEKKKGCAKLDGNCRYRFCKEVCMKPQAFAVKPCRENCFYAAPTLMRLSAGERGHLYGLYYPQRQLECTPHTTRQEMLREITKYKLRSPAFFEKSVLSALEEKAAKTSSKKTSLKDRVKGTSSKKKLEKINKEIRLSKILLANLERVDKEIVSNYVRQWMSYQPKSSVHTPAWQKEEQKEQLQKEKEYKEAEQRNRNDHPEDARADDALEQRNVPGTFKLLWRKPAIGGIGKFLNPVEYKGKFYRGAIIHPDRLANIPPHRRLFVAKSMSPKGVASLFNKIRDGALLDGAPVSDVDLSSEHSETLMVINVE